MYVVYALASKIRNYIYVGLTANMPERLRRHNSGYEKTTRPYRPFVVIFQERCPTRIEARKREKYWKSGTGKEKLRELRDEFFKD